MSRVLASAARRVGVWRWQHTAATLGGPRIIAASATPACRAALFSTAAPPDRPPADDQDVPASGEGDAAELGGAAEGQVDAAKLQQDLSKAQEELKETQDKYIRALAEMENVRRRSRLDLDNERKYALTSFARSLLEVADNLGLALTNVSDEDMANERFRALHEGVVLTEKSLQKVFNKHHIHQFAALHQKFDPSLHQALFEVPDDTLEPGTVSVVTTQGYMYHERVLRPAAVGVVARRR